MRDLEHKIKEWLAEQGYPLEMRAASAFRDAGFFVTQSEYYQDATSGAHRETDVIARFIKRVDHVELRVTFVLECKASTQKPWLLLSASNFSMTPDSRITIRMSSIVGGVFLRIISRDEDVQALPFFQLPGRLGYGVTQAFTSGKDVCYEACMTVLSGSAAQVREADTRTKESQSSLAEIIFPIPVLDGRLFEVALGSGNKLEVVETEMATLVWQNPALGQPFSVVRICTARAMDEVVKQALQTAQALAAKEVAMREVERQFRP